MSNETADLQMFNSALEKALVAECDSQRAEIERLRAECHRWKHHAEQRLIALREVEAELRAALAGKEGP